MNKKKASKIKKQPGKPITLFIKRRPVFFSLICFSAICAVLYAVMAYNRDFAEWFSSQAASKVRWTLGAVMSVAPFSVAEVLTLFFCVFTVFVLISLIVYLFRVIFGDARARFPRGFSVIVMVCLVVLDLFVITFAPCYRRVSVEEHLGIGGDIDEDKLFNVLDWFIDELNTSCEKVTYNERGASLCLTSFAALSSKINNAVDSLCSKYDFLQNKGFRAKPVMLSEPWTYTHVSGVYTFFTGESNVNINYPDYVIAYSAAHECAHQRGVAFENEANFIALLVCLESDDDFIRYAGLCDVYSTIANSAYKTNKDRYYTAAARLNKKISGEYSAFSEFFKKYEKNIYAETASKINDGYLKSQGQQSGVVSYSLITKMTVNYIYKTYLAE